MEFKSLQEKCDAMSQELSFSRKKILDLSNEISLKQERQDGEIKRYVSSRIKDLEKEYVEGLDEIEDLSRMRCGLLSILNHLNETVKNRSKLETVCNEEDETVFNLEDIENSENELEKIQQEIYNMDIVAEDLDKQNEEFKILKENFEEELVLYHDINNQKRKEIAVLKNDLKFMNEYPHRQSLKCQTKVDNSFSLFREVEKEFIKAQEEFRNARNEIEKCKKAESEIFQIFIQFVNASMMLKSYKNICAQDYELLLNKTTMKINSSTVEKVQEQHGQLNRNLNFSLSNRFTGSIAIQKMINDLEEQVVSTDAEIIETWKEICCIDEKLLNSWQESFKIEKKLLAQQQKNLILRLQAQDFASNSNNQA